MMSDEPVEASEAENLVEWMKNYKRKGPLSITRNDGEEGSRKFSIDEVKEFLEEYSETSPRRDSRDTPEIPEGFEISVIKYTEEGVSEVVVTQVDKGLRFVLMGITLGFVIGLVFLLTLIRIYPGFLFIF